MSTGRWVFTGPQVRLLERLDERREKDPDGTRCTGGRRISARDLADRGFLQLLGERRYRTILQRCCCFGCSTMLPLWRGHMQCQPCQEDDCDHGKPQAPGDGNG